MSYKLHQIELFNHLLNRIFIFNNRWTRSLSTKAWYC